MRAHSVWWVRCPVVHVVHGSHAVSVLGRKPASGRMCVWRCLWCVHVCLYTCGENQALLPRAGLKPEAHCGGRGRCKCVYTPGPHRLVPDPGRIWGQPRPEAAILASQGPASSLVLSLLVAAL